jgi:serine/threonine-protein kinase OSR1/STK39
MYPTSPEEYELYEKIGEGAFAEVYHGSIIKSGMPVAIKVMDLDKFEWGKLVKEINIMRQLRHPNVVQMYTSFVVDNKVWVIMELHHNGSLLSVLKRVAQNGLKSEELLASILKSVLEGIAYCHKNEVIHRDIKADNILLSEKGDVKLADFGVSGKLLEGGNRKDSRHTFTGTVCWMAPEILKYVEGYTTKVDIWSFGITAIELAFGKAPHSHLNPVKILMIIVDELPPNVKVYEGSKNFSREFKDMISKCLVKDPSKRPTAKNLLKHKFFRKAKCRDYIVKNLVSKLPYIQPLSKVIKLPKQLIEAFVFNEDWIFNEDLIFNRFEVTDVIDEPDLETKVTVGRFEVTDC